MSTDPDRQVNVADLPGWPEGQRAVTVVGLLGWPDSWGCVQVDSTIERDDDGDLWARSNGQLTARLFSISSPSWAAWLYRTETGELGAFIPSHTYGQIGRVRPSYPMGADWEYLPIAELCTDPIGKLFVRE